MSKSAYMFPGVTSLSQMSAHTYEAFSAWLKFSEYDISDFLLSANAVTYAQNREYEKLSAIDAQIVGYMVSCAVHDTYMVKRGYADYVSGYSVGVFAALYAAGSLSFTSGISLLCQLNELITFSYLENEKFAMATVVGLERVELENTVDRREGVEIINQNSEINFIISGVEKSVKALEAELLESGALFFKILPIKLPYHSSWLLDFKEDWKSIINKHAINPPQVPVVSATTAQVITERNNCMAELENNFCSSFSWFGVLQKTWNLGVRDIYQCGASRDLYKIGKYSGVPHIYHELK